MESEEARAPAFAVLGVFVVPNGLITAPGRVVRALEVGLEFSFTEPDGAQSVLDKEPDLIRTMFGIRTCRLSVGEHGSGPDRL